MKYFLLFLLIIVGCKQYTHLNAQVSEETAAKEIKGTLINSTEQLDKPYVILISLDGFRYDYAERYGATNLLDFEVKVEKMISSFPSKTFPNHYAIASGLYPGHNGLVSNEFYDRSLNLTYNISNRKVVENPRFYNGTPLWVLATQQKMANASMFWVGSEAPIKGVYPTYYYKYDGSINHADRVNQAITWLQLPEKSRPHFIAVYFSVTDDIGHQYGPDSNEISQAVKEIDKTIGNLISKINQLNLPINIIVVSDHGMIEVDRENIIYLEELLPSNVKFTTSFPAMIYSNNKNQIDSIYQKLATDTTRYKVYLKDNLPDGYHYDAAQERIGDIIITPKAPYIFGSKSTQYAKGTSTHGYDPKFTPEMGAIFYAKGPAFKKVDNFPPFENIHVYPLVAKILGLTYEKDSIDGRIEVLFPLLK
ncbi:MAG: ectonucleotide pyrophosphatase/phosphodiesterase [Cyclobacteriaceae bacterium]|nr:ectonucleotide pyrophosphatase/phosphodiesterase [Cyclobacteriaceae bacterium]